jgi:hypothetical protein
MVDFEGEQEFQMYTGCTLQKSIHRRGHRQESMESQPRLPDAWMVRPVEILDCRLLKSHPRMNIVYLALLLDASS